MKTEGPTPVWSWGKYFGLLWFQNETRGGGRRRGKTEGGRNASKGKTTRKN